MNYKFLLHVARKYEMGENLFYYRSLFDSLDIVPQKELDANIIIKEGYRDKLVLTCIPKGKMLVFNAERYQEGYELHTATFMLDSGFYIVSNLGPDPKLGQNTANVSYYAKDAVERVTEVNDTREAYLSSNDFAEVGLEPDVVASLTYSQIKGQVTDQMDVLDVIEKEITEIYKEKKGPSRGR